MPWHVAKSSTCPTSRPWAVILDSTGKAVACHGTKAEATKHMQALYANENSSTPAPSRGTLVPVPADKTGSPIMPSTTIAERARAAHRAERPPTTGLARTVPFYVRSADSADDVNDGLTLDGYAATFRAETIIDSWEGRFWESLRPGSTRKSLRENTPRLQFDHGTHPTIGSIPIGKIERVAEEVDPELAPDGGVHVLGRLFDNWLIQPVRDAIAGGAIDGMSFRFGIVREQWKDAEGKIIKDEEALREALFRSWYNDVPDDELLHRELIEVRVPELGPVVWPAYEQTSVSVRSADRGKVVIDLSRLARDPIEQRKVAEVMWRADEVLGGNSHPAPEGEGIVGSAEQDAPGSTPEAETHPSSERDAPETTGDTSPAEDHPSTEAAGRSSKRALAQWTAAAHAAAAAGLAAEAHNPHLASIR